MIGKKLNYRGHVQGVGFRYRTHALAASYAVCGYVKNLDDGSVELVVEGGEETVDAFLLELKELLATNIAEISEQMVDKRGYQGFVIQR